MSDMEKTEIEVYTLKGDITGLRVREIITENHLDHWELFEAHLNQERAVLKFRRKV